jgi:hypothetical protein
MFGFQTKTVMEIFKSLSFLRTLSIEFDLIPQPLQCNPASQIVEHQALGEYNPRAHCGTYVGSGNSLHPKHKIM